MPTKAAETKEEYADLAAKKRKARLEYEAKEQASAEKALKAEKEGQARVAKEEREVVEADKAAADKEAKRKKRPSELIVGRHRKELRQCLRGLATQVNDLDGQIARFGKGMNCDAAAAVVAGAKLNATGDLDDKNCDSIINTALDGKK